MQKELDKFLSLIKILIGKDGQLIDGPPSNDQIFSLFENHHLSLKTVLNDMLTPIAREMISLGAGNA